MVGELEMTDKIILQLTLDELKLIDKYVELNDETLDELAQGHSTGAHNAL